MSEALPEGLYESLVTDALRDRLQKSPDLQADINDVDESDTPHVLARHLTDTVRSALMDLPPEDRVAAINRLLTDLGRSDELVHDGVRQLQAITRTDRLATTALPRPSTPLSDAALLTNAKDEPVLGTELRTELASTDSVDLLCAFIKWHGLRLLEEPLSALRERGIRMRVLTTTYVGATERRALDELIRRFGAEVKVNYETQSTRLHAKAWLLRRDSGFDTAYVGSSNLSRSALVDGLEWNVRLSGIATPDLIRKFEATFDSYWLDESFNAYDPDRDADRLDDALRVAGGATSSSATITLAGLEVTARPHQTSTLEALEAERARGRHRNLVVAATGTGKTIVAALDYRNLRETAGEGLSLLFVAHRQEILQQSLRAYREVLGDGSFGELYVGGMRPERWRHVFASVQALTSYGIDRIDPEQFDVVVIDEFHHARARSYESLLAHLRPQELLGLTATPERGDGFDVRALFGGRAAYELRLWGALKEDLLVPFHYFGIADDVDLTGVEWKRGSYDLKQLDLLYTGNDARTVKVLRELRHKVTDVRAMRAIGFCVSVRHAEYMAAKFNEAGIAALAVSGDTGRDERSGALDRLRGREVNVLFAADLYNEGLDLPKVDTILMLRPTASATVFLQQLGRGLRRAPGKAVLTVLDFIGNQRREFRFDQRYRSLTGTSRKRLDRDIANGFPYLPSGSQIVLDRVAQNIVLDNVRSQLRMTTKQLSADVRSHGEQRLADYLRESGVELTDIYPKRTWTQMLRNVGFPTPAQGPDEDALLRRVRSMLHVDDRERASAYRRFLADDGPSYGQLTEREQKLARMLLFTVWSKLPHYDYEQALDVLRRHPAVCGEMDQLIEIADDASRHVTGALGEGLQHVPVATHARYRREEILAAFGYASLERKPGSHMTGVAWAEDTQTDLLLVNLHKSEAHFSPNTMYRDFALSTDHFHWESQNSTTASGAVGRRYREHSQRGSHVVLFVRDAPEDEFGAGAPFMCLGQVDYVTHSGEKPMAISWQLRREMPADLYVQASAVAR